MEQQAVATRAVFVVGASSVGKTTLCKAIVDNLAVEPDRWIKETAREVMRTQGFSRDTTHKVEMQHAIMAAQLNAEERVLTRPRGNGPILLLSDRSAVDPIVYAATSSVDGESKRLRLIQDPAFQATLAFYRESLFFLLQPVLEWLQDDGIRSLEDPWNYNAHLRTTLTELGIPFVEIGEELKDIAERVEIASEVKHAHIEPSGRNRFAAEKLVRFIAGVAKRFGFSAPPCTISGTVP
ncbi:uncharacterized protein PHACADRAFT_211456 [Phanerochaete carnosa HHB-10118-sp]|uniref:NadR/Ttd14 AAA domain-containing protein n=1 Tax=Phanerochaete carnosa (strain HHB-10118-sp) TaxID=650164 RepID=K5WTT2_PHACS|nr:uncharacterized protein PHACADRAFT_211456 [Phanerochaete carnosa HHB-10118-sp]EKM53817.1 hypothetical protein PHACADRAFT_211456 [Phanerochaete carnosa HHB-10118-sp]